MALQVADRVQVQSTSYTTSSFTLGSAVTGFQSFSALTNGNTTYYAATDLSGNWEVGYGAYTSATPALARTTILSSSNSGSVVTFSGTVNVFITYPAEKVVIQDANGNATVNLLYEGFSNVAAAGTTTVLTASSTPNWVVTGSGGQTYQLPDATTLSPGILYTFNNNQSSGTIVVKNNSSTTIATVQSGGFVTIILLANGSAAGSWDYHANIPSGTSWSTNTLSTGSAITSTQAVTGNTLISTVATGTAPLTVTSTTQVANLNAATAGSAGSVTNALTLNNGGAGAASGTTYNGSSAITVSYNTVGASPLAGSTSLTTLGTVTIGTWNASTIAIGYGGTGTTVTPTNGQLLIGNGTTYTVASLGTSTGISTTVGAGTLTINNTGVTSNVAGTGISVSGATGAVTITNAGVTSAVAGTGISVSGATGAVTITNSGVTSLTGTASQVTVSASTGSVTLSLPSTINVNTSGNAATAYGLNVQSSGSAPGSNVVLRSDGNGYVFTNYINSNTSNSENPSVSQVIVTNGSDNYYRKSSISSFTSAVQSNASGSWGISVTGTSSNITSYTINQSVGTGNNVQFNSLGVGTAGSGTTGEIRATNNVTAYYSSDAKFKENIHDVPNALEIVCAIGSKIFDWTDAYLTTHGGEDGYFIRKSDFGVIAQDVEKVFSRAVRTREDGSLAVDYEKLSTLAFGAIAQLLERVEALENK
jgi:Chaperone of endosialidase